jgi:kinesin family protein C2/C3
MLLEWLNNTLPDLSLPLNSSDEDLRMCLSDGTVLCRLLSRLRPGFVKEVVESFFIFLFYQAML